MALPTTKSLDDKTPSPNGMQSSIPFRHDTFAPERCGGPCCTSRGCRFGSAGTTTAVRYTVGSVGAAACPCILREPKMAAALRALALLGAIAASLVLFVYDLSNQVFAEFVKTNRVQLPIRMRLLAAMAAAFALSVAGGAFYGWYWDLRRLQRVSRRLAPLAALGFLPALCTPDGWPDALTAALAIGAFVLVTERLLRLSFEAVAQDAPVAAHPDAAPAGGWGVLNRLSRFIRGL